MRNLKNNAQNTMINVMRLDITSTDDTKKYSRKYQQKIITINNNRNKNKRCRN